MLSTTNNVFPLLSMTLTWSMTTLHSLDLLYIMCRNGHFSQAVVDISFLFWTAAVTGTPTVAGKQATISIY